MSGHDVYASAADQRFREEQAKKHRRGEPHNVDRCPMCQAGEPLA